MSKSHGNGAVLCRFLELDLGGHAAARARGQAHRLTPGCTGSAPRAVAGRRCTRSGPSMVVFCSRPTPVLERRMRSLLELVGGNQKV